MGAKLFTKDEIFNTAAEIPDAEKRAAYLEQACGDDSALRAEIERLLEHDRSEDSLLDRSVPGLNAIDGEPNGERPGTVIGAYTLLQQIGEGGMGVVFLAEQERPVKRRVALKVIKPGLDTRQVIARFEAERLVLAMMDHPNIAKVLDAGTTAARSGEQGAGSPEEFLLHAPYSPLPASSGRPYFVMELVQGVPITEYCDECNLTTQERLELFIVVCRAVQHAHQKGIIHRDLKPTNVLVAVQDGQAAPKIIDFGVAKAIEQRLTKETLTTAFAQMVGTPLYMSPEQAELSPLGVDTRSDIYSLGVMLYELLTGTTPFDKDRLHAAPYDELRRIVREEEPPRPSARLSTLAAEKASTVADHRRTDTRRLTQQVRGELDWIVMKCLEKDRNRRYESPASLARDIERYLQDEPVQACPPSTSYRLRKFVNRNRSLLAATGAIATALLVGFGVSTWMYFRERAAVQVAKANEARATTESARAQAVSDLLQEMLASSNPDQVKGSNYTVRQLLDDFSAGLDNQLENQPVVEADIRSVIGKSYWRLGVFDRAEVHSKKALDLRRRHFGPGDERVADSLVDYAWTLAEQGRYGKAKKQIDDALAIYRRQDSDARRTVRALWALQQLLIRQSRLAEAEAVANEALVLAGSSKDTEFAELPNILHALADAKVTEKKFDEAEKWARQAVGLHRRLHGDEHPETAWGLYSLGRALSGQQKFADAETPLQEAVTIFRRYYDPKNQSVQGIRRELKSVLEAKGDRAALDALASVEAEEASRADDPTNHVRLASLLLKNTPTEDQKREAHRFIRRAMEGYDQIAVEYPTDLERRGRALEGCVLAIAPCISTPGLESEVDEFNRRLALALPKLAAEFPESDNGDYWSALLYRAWAGELMDYAAYELMAEQHLSKAIEIMDDRFLSDPDRIRAWLELATMHALRGDVRWRLGKLDGAETDFLLALQIQDENLAHLTDDPMLDTNVEVAVNDLRAALYLVAVQKNDQAAELVRKTIANATHFTNPSYRVAAHWIIGQVQLQLGDEVGYRESCKAMVDVPFGALDDLAKARQILAWVLAPDALEDLSLVVKRAEEFAASNSLGQPHVGPYLLGAALYRDGRYDRAAELLNKSIDVYPSYVQPGYDLINHQRLLLAMTTWQQGQKDEARRMLFAALPDVDEQIQTRSTSFPRAIAQIYRREAVALIELKEVSEAVENEKTDQSVTKTDN